jgi:hypothetical protein
MREQKRPHGGNGETTWTGEDRRRATPVGGYKGEERRKVDPMRRMPGGNPQGGNPGGRGEDPTE